MRLNSHLGREKSEEDGIVKRKSNLSKRSLIWEKVDGGSRQLKGLGQWSHQRALCEWGETVE